MSSKWALARVIILGVALAVVTVMLSRRGADPMLRVILMAAFVLYGVRLFLVAADARRRAQRAQRERMQREREIEARKLD